MTVADWPRIITDDQGDEVFVDVVNAKVHFDTANARGLIILGPARRGEFLVMAEAAFAEAERREAAGLPGEPAGCPEREEGVR